MTNAILAVITPNTMDTDYYTSLLGRNIYAPTEFLTSGLLQKYHLDNRIKKDRDVYELAL